MQHIVNFAKNRGFVYAGSEIYGGLANSWDYGPYGSVMKENIKNLWIKEFVQKHTNMTLLDAGILMNPEVWVASGHVGGFSDPLIDDKVTKQRFRADKLLEEEIDTRLENMEKDDLLNEYKEKYNVNNLVPESWEFDQMRDCIRGEGIKNPNTNEEADWTDVRQFNLMFKTFQGVTEEKTSTVYLRPETAQGIFVNFANIARTSRKKIPFGIGQIGKAFRNEITPGNFIFRTREFEQMEIEFFCEPGTDLEWHAEWKKRCEVFLKDVLKIEADNLRFRDHEDDELSHYSNATTDIEYKFPMGWGELWGIADRTDFDLKAHMQHSGQDLSYFDPVENKKYIPYCIEPSVGLTRLFLATMCDAYTEVEEDDGSKRIVMKFDPKVAPVKIGIVPIVKKLGKEAMEVFDLLAPHFQCEYDEVGKIGKRYYRFDEIGTPWCIAVDSDNFDQGQVTVRHRDTMEQEVVKIDELVSYFTEKLK